MDRSSLQPPPAAWAAASLQMLQPTGKQANPSVRKSVSYGPFPHQGIKGRRKLVVSLLELVFVEYLFVNIVELHVSDVHRLVVGRSSCQGRNIGYTSLASCLPRRGSTLHIRKSVTYVSHSWKNSAKELLMTSLEKAHHVRDLESWRLSLGSVQK